MLNRKNLILSVAFLMLLSIVSAMAAGQEERGSGSFSVPRTVTAAGTEIKAGEYNIKWESQAAPSTAVTVEFKPIDQPQGVKVQGKIEPVNTKYGLDSLGIVKDSSGRDIIKELRYGGKKMKIVFD